MALSLGTVVTPVTMKWHVAVAVGLPVAVGVGYWFLIRKNKSSKAITCGGVGTKTRELSLDSDTSNKVSEKHEEKTSLEEAIVLKEKGNKYFKNGLYEEAVNYYNKAIEVCPKSESISLATFYQNKAAAYEQLKNYDEVKKACSEALLLNPKYTKAFSRRAKAYEHTKELRLAFEDLTAVCILENFQSQSTMIKADTVLRELIQHNIKEAMSKRVPTLPSGHCITSFLSTFTNDPVHPFTSQTEGDFSKGFLKAVDCLRKKDYETVISACTEEILDDKALYRNEALVLRGTFYQLSGNFPAARSDFETIINDEKIDPKLRVNALLKHACIHIQLDELKECYEDFERATQIDPNNSDIYHHRGQINLTSEKLEEAAEDLQKASDLEPNYPVTAVYKCYLDYRSALKSKDDSKFEAIFERFEQLIRDYPQSGECYSLYAQVLCGRDEYEKSDKLYQKALKVDPKNATFLVHRAVVQLKWTADVDVAVKLLNEALKLDDKCVLGYETLATLELQRGNLKEGIELIEKAINLANTEAEMSFFFSLKNAAETQKKMLEKINMQTTEGVTN